MSRRWSILVATVLGLFGWQLPSRAEAPAVSALQRSNVCGARAPAVSTGEQSAQTTMRVSSSGGWCWFDVSATYASPRYVATYSVTNGPAHGEVVTGAVDQQARIAYRPAPSFLGEDSFLIVNGTTNSQRPVTVTIVK